MALTKPNALAVQKTGQAITGKAAFTAVAGTGVQIKNAAGSDEVEIEKATGPSAYLLTRDILSEADYDAAILQEHQFGNTYADFLTPTKEGDPASAHEARTAEFEGSDLLDVAEIDGSTTAGDEVVWAAGKLTSAVAGAGCGIVKSILPVQDAGNATRILVEFKL